MSLWHLLLIILIVILLVGGFGNWNGGPFYGVGYGPGGLVTLVLVVLLILLLMGRL